LGCVGWQRNNTNEEGEERQEKRGLDAYNDNSSVMEAKLHPACCLFFLNQLMLPFLGTEDMRDVSCDNSKPEDERESVCRGSVGERDGGPVFAVRTVPAHQHERR
jgi:hypothetical protein